MGTDYRQIRPESERCPDCKDRINDPDKYSYCVCPPVEKYFSGYRENTMKKEKLEKIKAKFKKGDSVFFYKSYDSDVKTKGTFQHIETNGIDAIILAPDKSKCYRVKLVNIKKFKEPKVYWFCEARDAEYSHIIQNKRPSHIQYRPDSYHGDISNWKRVKLVVLKDE